MMHNSIQILLSLLSRVNHFFWLQVSLCIECIDILKLQTYSKILKPNGAFWRYLKDILKLKKTINIFFFSYVKNISFENYMYDVRPQKIHLPTHIYY